MQKEVGEQIAPTVRSEVQNQFAPTLEQIAGLQSQQGEVKNELDAARNEIDAVEQRQNQTAARLQASQQETTVALRKESESLKSEVRADIKALDNGVNQKLRKFDGLDEKLNRLDALNNRLIQLERQSVEDRVRKLEKQVEALTARVIQLSDGQRPR